MSEKTKLCPHCKATLPFEAGFCLYCMTPLTEKETVPLQKKGTPFVLWAAVILLTVIALVLLFCTGVFTRTVPTVSPTVLPTATPTATPTASPTVTPTVTPTTVPQETVSYRYRVNGSNATEITVTGVSAPSANGVYRIPEKIDGYRVTAIASTTFSDGEISPTVKKVVLPKTVRSVQSRTFSSCYGLTDLYLCGEYVSMANVFVPAEERSFPLTIHASRTCENDASRRYCVIASYDYGAQYEEWSGEGVS